MFTNAVIGIYTICFIRQSNLQKMLMQLICTDYAVMFFTHIKCCDYLSLVYLYLHAFNKVVLMTIMALMGVPYDADENNNLFI